MVFAMIIVLSAAAPYINGSDIAAILTALGGIIVGLFAAHRRSRSERERLETAERDTTLAAYNSIIKTLQDEVLRQRTQTDNDRREYDSDKREWQHREEYLENQIRELKKRLRD